MDGSKHTILEEAECTSKVNFKEWLAEQGVDTALFWKNCRKRYNKLIGSPRRKYLKSHCPAEWIAQSFGWHDALQKSRKKWYELHTKWQKICLSNEVEFGFTKG